MERARKRHPLRINRNHFELDKIIKIVGRVSRPVYVYGLLDRTQYDFCISPDLRSEVNEFLILNGIYWKYFGIRRLPATRILQEVRYGESDNVVKLLKYICKARKKIIA